MPQIEFCFMYWHRFLNGIGEGQIPLVDRAYDSNAMRADLKARGAWACVKPMPNRKNVLSFSTFLCCYRHKVECFFNEIKHFRAFATCYEKHAESYLALVKLAAIRIWLRNDESVSW